MGVPACSEYSDPASPPNFSKVMLKVSKLSTSSKVKVSTPTLRSNCRLVMDGGKLSIV